MTKKVNRTKLENTKELLFHYLSRYKKQVVWLTILAVVSAALNAAVPYLTGWLIDSILNQEPIMTVAAISITLPWILLAAWFIVQLATYAIDWTIERKRVAVGADVFFDYFSRGFSHTLYLPVSFHKREKSGRVGHKIVMAANRLETFFGQIIFDLAPQFLSIIVALVLVVFIEWTFSLVLLAGVALYILILSRQIKPLAGLQQKINRKFSSAFGRAFDATQNAQAVKQSTAEDYEQQRFSRLFKGTNRNLWVNMFQIWALLSFWQRIIILTVQLTIFGLSIVYVGNGVMSIGELVAVNAYTTLVFGPFAQLGRQWQMIQNGIVDVYEAERILSRPPEKYEPTRDKTPPSIDGYVTFENVWFWYEPQKIILSELSFSASPGETVALVGESGVGKSTLVELISGYYFPKRGRITIDGANVKSINLSTLRDHIAVVSQDVVLFNDTIKRNITYGAPKVNDEEIEEAARKAHLLDDIHDFPKQWQQQVGERGIQLSGGQKQRVAIARAILRSPTILILDEPTSALDAKTEEHIQDSLAELMEGRTTFIIAHRLRTVRDADQILVMKDGTITESGTHRELIEHEEGEYRRLYDLQIGLHE